MTYDELKINWLEGGWDFLFAEMHELLPEISKILEEQGEDELLAAFKMTMDFLPEYAWEDEDLYYDVINFFSRLSYKPEDERLKALADDKRMIVKKYRSLLETMDDICEREWGQEF